MEKYLIIRKVIGSIGNGYAIHAEVDSHGKTYRCKEMTYYGYSKRDAISNYRNEINAKGLHFDYIEY